MKIQQTITLTVKITVEYDPNNQTEEYNPIDPMEDIDNMAQIVWYGLEYLDDNNELCRGGEVKEYSAKVENIEETNYIY